MATGFVRHPASGTFWPGVKRVIDGNNCVIPSVNISPDGAGYDAFGRLRSSNPFTLFESQLQYDKQNLFWDEDITGSATVSHVVNESCVELALTTASGDKAIRQSRKYHRYEPGKSQLVLMTGVIGESKANVRRRLGYFDDENGIFYEEDGTGLYIVKRTFTSGSAVDTRVAQAEWSTDSMDGNGPSGFTLDLTKANIFFVDMEWLGVGQVRVGLVMEGRVCPSHVFSNANKLDTVYMTTANLPVRYEIENTGTAASASELRQICCTVIAEGGFDSLGVVRGFDTGITPVVVNVAAAEAILNVRLKSSRIRSILEPVGYSVYIGSNTGSIVQIVLGATITGGSWVSAGSDSIAEYNITNTAYSGGEVVWSGYVDQRGADTISLRQALSAVADISGTADVISLVVQPLTGANSNFYGALNIRELV